MTIQLTREGMRAIFPRAPQAVIDAFVAKHAVLDRAGITHTRTRLAYFFANIEHECGGFTIPNLTESLAYTAQRMAQIWPNRFASADAVRAKYGTGPGWQVRAFDDVYGSRMGNRPNSHDGSTFIGRGGPQWTGRDGYGECQKRAGVPALTIPESVSDLGAQPEVCAAFWDWKKLNARADIGDFKGAVKLWNGGSNGMADRLAQMKGNDPIIARLAEVERIMPEAKALPGSPPTAAPPKEVIEAVTEKERRARTVGVGAAAPGAASEGTAATKTATGTEQPVKPFLPPIVSYTLIGVGVAVVLFAAWRIARKRAAVVKNWF